MKFIVDENIPFEVFQILKDKGLDITSVTSEYKRLSDDEILSKAVKEKRVIITFDKDFGKMIFKEKKNSFGVVLLRIRPQSVDYILSQLTKVLDLGINFSISFCVVGNHTLRIIPLF